MQKINYFNLIDLGSSKIRFSVIDKNLNQKFTKTKKIEFDKEYKNQFNIINEIVREAEKKISFHIEDIILILDTPNLLTVDISLKKKFDKSTKLIKAYDSLVLELNQLIISHYSNYSLTHIVVNNCNINENYYDELPKSLNNCKNIKIEFKVILIPKKLVTNLTNNFIKINLNVINIFCTSYVKSISYLKTLGLKKISFLEIGWERSTLITYKKNKLKFITTIPVGSSHITKDISNIFKISLDDAEKIKKLFNKSETEFSYENKNEPEVASIKEIIRKNISIDLLKKVILYRVQEIIDLIFIKSSIKESDSNLKDFELFLIGEGSTLFQTNSFYLNDKFLFKSMNYYPEDDFKICKSGLNYYLNNYEIPKIINKKHGIFEKFFNYFSR